ncbi:MAG: hypothetical protein K1X64_13495 [Myxococcaceae bacterium]|nr:hypothetical protein [Myxococcaceae bacterium]
MSKIGIPRYAGENPAMRQVIEAAALPGGKRRVKTSQGEVEVAKVEVLTAGRMRIINEYGADGKLLKRTTQRLR